MKNRREFLLTLTAGLVALAVVITPVIADELMGVITKIDVDAKKLTVQSKEDGKDVVVTTNDDTEIVFGKNSNKADSAVLEKLSKNLAKIQDQGKPGMQAKVIHEKGVASKISIGFGKGKKDQ